MMFPALAALFLWQGLHFSDVRAWRWSEGRGEFIPALSAEVDNRSGQDYAAVRLLVRVRCAEGGAREYQVQVRDVLLGRQRVEATAYDAIGAVKHCEGAAEIGVLEATPFPAGQRPAFAVFGFSMLMPDGRVSTDLEGILDYRTDETGPRGVELRSWRRHGARLELPGFPDTAFYCVRVPPGRMGLAGFALEGGPEPRSPVTRFLRFYDVAPGQALWLGLFRLEMAAPARVALGMEPAPEAMRRLAEMLPRPLAAGRAVPAPASSVVVH